MEGFCQFCRKEIGAGHSFGCPYYAPKSRMTIRERLEDFVREPDFYGDNHEQQVDALLQIVQDAVDEEKAATG